MIILPGTEKSPGAMVALLVPLDRGASISVEALIKRSGVPLASLKKCSLFKCIKLNALNKNSIIVVY